MRDIRFLHKPHYSTSRALIIGINSYKNAPPLSFAVNDAKEVRKVIVKEFDFPKENVTLLTDDNATKESILKHFLQYTTSSIGVDERILIFYAGHGHTKLGLRGEVGYLVPYDSDLDDPSTLIRWDEFTRNAEIVRAKHMLFIMDACYGGLALKRNLGPGATRFLNDMLLRYTRQVLTAGKADELVADSGGPIPNHSVFTGHLINGLRGQAATEQGVITANGLMAYVHRQVAYDQNSNQTPHYGYLDGDGDFIFHNPTEGDVNTDKQKDLDTLIVIPVIEDEYEYGIQAKVEKVKRLLSDETSAIELHDYLVKEVKQFLSRSSEDNFTTQGILSNEELLERLNRYEEITKDLTALLVCVSHWGRDSHLNILRKIIARATDRLEPQAGSVLLLNLRWYPLILVMYYAGISAISGGRYKSLASILNSPVASPENRYRVVPFYEAASDLILELIRSNVFKQIPGHERNFAPMSEYLFKLLQPLIDDILFIGKSYESIFDEFELIFALVVADERQQQGHDAWGPIGRFGWKHKRPSQSPLAKLIEIATKQANEWAPLRAGIFGGDIDRFLYTANKYKKLVDGLGWH